MTLTAAAPVAAKTRKPNIRKGAIATLVIEQLDGSEPIVLDFTKRDAHIITITPRMAAEWLERNEANRKMSPKNLDKIMADMRNDSYRFTGEAIKFSTTGKLLDGQHRLTAIVRTGKSLEIVVVTGVMPLAQSVMDSGRIRNLADALELSGEAQCTNLATVLTAAIQWDNGVRNSDNNSSVSITTSSALEYLAAHPELRAITKESVTLAPKVTGLTLKQISQLIRALDKLDADDRKDFFSKLISGAGLAEGNPILALRNILAADAKATTSMSSYHRMALTTKAWNAYRDGREVQSLRFKVGGAKPESFHEPM